MGVFSKTSKDALILDRYATRLVVLDPSAEGLRLTKIGEAIADLVQELNVKGSVANYSVSGQSVFIRFVKLPALDDTDVEQLIRFEAQQHVPFPLDEVVWDYHLLPAKGLEREAVLVAIKAEDLDSLNDEIVSHNLSTGKVDCALTSLYNAYVDSYPDEKEPVMLIDIGAKSTDLIYSEQGRFFTRSISAGGIFVTSAIAREFNVPFMEAERLKTTSGLVSMSNGQTEGLDPATANLATVIRTAMTRLASEIQRTTNHYRAQMNGSAPVKAYLCGGGCRTLFPWGDGLDYSMRLHWFEDMDEDENRPYDMEEPNFFGLSIAYDPYMREVVQADRLTTCGGDGGCNICGGLGPFLGFLPCSPHCKPEVQEDNELNGDYDFYRPIIRLENYD